MSRAKEHERIRKLEKEIKEVLEGTTIFTNVRFYNEENLVLRYKIVQQENESVVNGFRECITDKLKESCHQISNIKTAVHYEENKFQGVYEERIILNPLIKEKEKAYKDILSQFKKCVGACLIEHSKKLKAYLRIKDAKRKAG